jgi:5-methyltetrahydrofolate--homocysteine methyltransferase
MGEVLRLMKTNCGKPLIAKPNAGSPQVGEGQEKYALGPEQFAQYAGEWIGEGARIVSACCGSSPLHLKEIVKKVREFGKTAA